MRQRSGGQPGTSVAEEGVSAGHGGSCGWGESWAIPADHHPWLGLEARTLVLLLGTPLYKWLLVSGKGPGEGRSFVGAQGHH